MAHQGTNLPKTASQNEEALYGVLNGPELVVRSVSLVGRRWQESCSLEPQTQPLSPATVRLSSKGQKTNPGGIFDSIQITVWATRSLLSRAGEAVSCAELGHRLKKDQQAPLPFDLWLHTCYSAVYYSMLRKAWPNKN